MKLKRADRLSDTTKEESSHLPRFMVLVQMSPSPSYSETKNLFEFTACVLSPLIVFFGHINNLNIAFIFF